MSAPKYFMGFMNFCSHDPGAALVKIENGNFEYIFAEEGFLSRRKKSYQFPIRSIEYCLNHFGIKIDQVDRFILDYMNEKTFFRTSNNYRLLAGDFIRSKMKINPERISFIKSHHLAHAYTAFYPSGFEDATVIIVDGLGSDNQTHSIYSANRHNGIKLLHQQSGTGIGSIYSMVTKKLGFASGEEGKTMGLAPYGAGADEIDNMLPSFEGDYDGLTVDYSLQMRRSPDKALRISLNTCTDKQQIYDPYFTRMAYNLQKETERCLVHLVKEAVQRTGISNVCLAGGVALNCVANGIIQNLDSVNQLFVYPASGDTGIPIGLALYGAEQDTCEWAQVISSKESIEKLSKPFSEDGAPLFSRVVSPYEKILADHAVNPQEFSAKVIAQRIADGEIVSFYQDGIELGPRALGHRSFLADPRSAKMKEIMNEKIKHREGYRPFAPMILKEHFNEYFIHPTDNHPYMLQAPMCRDKAKNEAPAIVHVDGTARVQTVTQDNGRVHEVLTEFYKITGVPILINTSFNDNNEPIVFTCLDALCCFGRTNADILVVNDSWFKRADISSIKLFINDSEVAQQKIRDEYFETAIKSNTTIDSSTQSKVLTHFFDYNAQLTSANRSEGLHLRLVKFLYSRDIKRTLYLDQYHFDFLNSMFENISGTFQAQIPNFKIVNDTLQAVDDITDNSDVLLYNFSQFDHGKQDLKVFYDTGDRMLAPLQSRSTTDIDKNALQVLMESYENDRSKTIEEFFETNIKGMA